MSASAESAHAAVIARRPFGRDRTQLEIEKRLAQRWGLVTVTSEQAEPIGEDAIPLVQIDDEGPMVLTSNPERLPSDGTMQVYLAPTNESVALQGSGGSAAP